MRLVQGDFSREMVFSSDPGEVARGFEAAGARRLHIVDLDGAFSGTPRNLPALEAILRAVKAPVQFGGGLRDLPSMERLLGMGVERAVLGTIAVEDPDLVAQACRRFPGRIIVSLDARRGWVAVRGWRAASTIKAEELLKQMTPLGVGRFIYTDIQRDGTLTRPNFAALKRLLASAPVPVIASGGISSLEHLQKLRALVVEGAIIGRALYTGNLDLKAALLAAGAKGKETTLEI